jgi:chromosomal replication initiation ATPase DnaA
LSYYDPDSWSGLAITCDDEIKEFYDRSHTAAVLGEKEFINWVRQGQLPEVQDKVLVAQVLPGTLSMAHVIRLVADYYQVEPAVLTEIVKGPKKGLLARKVAMYMCQQLGGYRLAEIMRPFGFSNIGSVSFITTQIRKRIKKSQEFSQAIRFVKQHIIQHAF